MEINLLAVWVVASVIFAVHHLTHLHYITQLALTQCNAGVFAHHQVDRLGCGDIQFAQEINVDCQRVAAKILFAMERLNDCSRKCYADCVFAKQIFILVNNHITLAI
jgi:hypothetical protein